MPLRLAALALALLVTACAPAAMPAPPPPRAPAFDRGAAARDVARELDDLHDAAAHADEERYFAHFAPNGVFLGTDATERWDVAAFRAYAHPYFAKGHGWTYHPTRRAVDFDPSGTTAWFDEDLLGERVGPTRGAGVLTKDAGGRWRITLYDLGFTVPNARFDAFRAAVDDLAARHAKASEDAAAAEARDPAHARAILEALVPSAKTRPDDPTEASLHDELAWLRWAEGDLAGALVEVDQLRATLDHGTLPATAGRALRLRERWDRAYLIFDEALRATPAERAGAQAAADAARAEYEALADPAGDRDATAVLAAAFAAQKGDARGLAAAAARVDEAHDTDLRQLYALARAYDAAKDVARAKALRARICAGTAGLWKELLVRAMASEGRACDTGT